MPWRGIFVVTVGLLVGGCALSAYQVASWTVTGVSYVFSGRGLGDHALSLATAKDCATWRLLQGKEVCVDYGSDFESSWSAMASTWGVPDALGQPVAVASVAGDGTPAAPAALGAQAPAALGVQEALRPEPVRARLIEQAATLKVRLDVTPPVEQAGETGLNFGGLVAPDRPVEAANPETPWLTAADAAPALDFAGLTVNSDIAKNVPRQNIALVTPGRPAIYLVLGSFRDRANAEALRARNTGLNMLVSKVQADSRATFRVLAGPFATAALRKARVELAKTGIRNAWAVKLCSGSLAPLPCEPVLQQASLPAR